MNCPNCKTEMEKGFSLAHGNYWRKKTDSFFSQIYLWGVTASKTKIWHYRCPKCSKIELYSEVQK